MSVDLYQSLGAGLEVSAGYRRLAFASVTDMYSASLTHYAGNWMTAVRVSLVPSIDGAGSTAGSGELRRYFGATGRSFVWQASAGAGLTIRF
jgi:YaiO family outer membrane protein